MELMSPLPPVQEREKVTKLLFQELPITTLRTTLSPKVAVIQTTTLFSANQDSDQSHSTLLKSIHSSKKMLTTLAQMSKKFNLAAQLVLQRLTNVLE